MITHRQQAMSHTPPAYGRCQNCSTKSTIQSDVRGSRHIHGHMCSILIVRFKSEWVPSGARWIQPTWAICTQSYLATWHIHHPAGLCLWRWHIVSIKLVVIVIHLSESEDIHPSMGGIRHFLPVERIKETLSNEIACPWVWPSRNCVGEKCYYHSCREMRDHFEWVAKCKREIKRPRTGGPTLEREWNPFIWSAKRWEWTQWIQVITKEDMPSWSPGRALEGARCTDRWSALLTWRRTTCVSVVMD